MCAYFDALFCCWKGAPAKIGSDSKHLEMVALDASVSVERAYLIPTDWLVPVYWYSSLLPAPAWLSSWPPQGIPSWLIFSPADVRHCDGGSRPVWTGREGSFWPFLTLFPWTRSICVPVYMQPRRTYWGELLGLQVLSSLDSVSRDLPLHLYGSLNRLGGYKGERQGERWPINKDPLQTVEWISDSLPSSGSAPGASLGVGWEGSWDTQKSPWHCNLFI